MRPRFDKQRPTILSLVLWLALPMAAVGQEVISVRAGMLSQTDGCVLVDGRYLEFKPWRVVHLSPEQRLRTDDGRAELMLGPEVFLRLGAFSEIEVVSTDLDSPQVRLLNGSIVIDVNRLERNSSVSLLAADGEVRVLKKGLYRVNVLPEGNVEAKVRSGQAAVSFAGTKQILADRERIALTGSPDKLTKERFTDSDGDYLEKWSNGRARTIAEINGGLLRKQMEDERHRFPRRIRGVLDIFKP